MAKKIILNPSELNFGNDINDIADIIETLKQERETEMVEKDEEFFEGYTFPLSSFPDYEFPRCYLTDICENIEESLDWINRDVDNPVWIEEDRLFILC